MRVWVDLAPASCVNKLLCARYAVYEDAVCGSTIVVQGLSYEGIVLMSIYLFGVSTFCFDWHLSEFFFAALRDHHEKDFFYGVKGICGRELSNSFQLKQQYICALYKKHGSQDGIG